VDFKNLRDQRYKWIILYFGGRNGSNEGVGYATQTANLPFEAKYHVRWKMDGTFYQRMIYDDGWQQTANYGNQHWAQKGDFVELRIPRSDLGDPSVLQVVSYLMNEKTGAEKSWGASPANAMIDGMNPKIKTSHEFDLRSMVGAASQIENYRLQVQQIGVQDLRVQFAPIKGAEFIDLMISKDDGVTWQYAIARYTLNDKSTFVTLSSLDLNTKYWIKLKVTGGKYGGPPGNSIGGSAIKSIVLKANAKPPNR
jgi:hypothetical protein